MSKATFYTHVQDRQSFVCKLVKTIQSKGQKLLIWLPDQAALNDLDTLLWTYEAESFIAHGVVGQDLDDDLPVLLGTGELPQGIRLPEVVLNLSDEFAHTQNQFERVLEIVGNEETALAQARARFQSYKKAGFEIEHFNREGQS